MMGYLNKEINKDMCEFVETILPNHFIVEGDISSHAYYIELEGTIQSTKEECFRFIKSIKANSNAVIRLSQFKDVILELKKKQDIQFMSPDDVIEAIDKIIDERNESSKVTEL